MWGWQEQRGRQGESCVYMRVTQLRSDGNWWTGKIVHSRAKPTLGSKKRNKTCQGWNTQFVLSHQEICVDPNTNGFRIERQFFSSCVKKKNY